MASLAGSQFLKPMSRPKPDWQPCLAPCSGRDARPRRGGGRAGAVPTMRHGAKHTTASAYPPVSPGAPSRAVPAPAPDRQSLSRHEPPQWDRTTSTLPTAVAYAMYRIIREVALSEVCPDARLPFRPPRCACVAHPQRSIDVYHRAAESGDSKPSTPRSKREPTSVDPTPCYTASSRSRPAASMRSLRRCSMLAPQPASPIVPDRVPSIGRHDGRQRPAAPDFTRCGHRHEGQGLPVHPLGQRKDTSTASRS